MSGAWGARSRTTTLDAAELSAQAARQLLREVCAEAGVRRETTETALLLTSELVTNAVVHASARPVLDVAVQPSTLRVSVEDDGAGQPRVPVDNPVLAEGGRGLFLVDALATRWGTEAREPRGKAVWFELDRV